MKILMVLVGCVAMVAPVVVDSQEATNLRYVTVFGFAEAWVAPDRTDPVPDEVFELTRGQHRLTASWPCSLCQ